MNSSSPSVRTRRSVLMFAALFSLALFGCKEAAEGSKGAVGAKPDFRLQTLDGRKLGPKDFLGEVVVIDFWATWCGPCRVQSRIIEPIFQDYQNKGVQFLAVNVGEDEATARKFAKEKPFPYPVLLDPDSKVSNSFEIYALPTMMVIDTKGKVTLIKSGVVDGPTLREAIKNAGA